MKFILEGRTYEAAAIDRLTLGDLIRLERETADMGRPMKWSELRAIIEHFEEEFTLDKDFDIEADDQFPWFLGMMIWATRRNAGEPVTFGEATEIRLGDIEVLEDEPSVKQPQDRKRKAADAKDPRRPRAASARGGAGRAKAARPKGLPAASVTT